MDNHQCLRHLDRNCDRVSGLLPCVELANAQRTKMDGRLCLCVSANVSSTYIGAPLRLAADKITVQSFRSPFGLRRTIR
jgi:hypothetical protein